MAQYNFGNLESPLSGTTFFNTHLEPWRDALHSSHIGDSRPTYAIAGMQWIDNTSNPWIVNVFDGTDDIPVGTIDTTTNIFTIAGIGSIVQGYNANLASLAGLTLAANKGLYSTGASTLALFDLTAAGRALLDDAAAVNQRATLGFVTTTTANAIAKFLDTTGQTANSGLIIDGSNNLTGLKSMVVGSQAGVSANDGCLNISSNNPLIYMREGDQGADGKVWRLEESGGTFIIRSRNDTDSTGISAMSITRSGINITGYTLNSNNSSIDLTMGADGTLQNTAATAAGNQIYTVRGSNVNCNFFERGSGGFGANAANACLKVATMQTTNRSVATGGTINASGADYAEYRPVKDGIVIKKGDLAGLNSDGELTNVFSEITGRVYIKSTAPNLVGNDSWGSEERLVEIYKIEPVGEKPRTGDTKYQPQREKPVMGIQELEVIGEPIEPNRPEFFAAMTKQERQERQAKFDLEIAEYKDRRDAWIKVSKAVNSHNAKFKKRAEAYKKEVAEWNMENEKRFAEFQKDLDAYNERHKKLQEAYEKERVKWDRVAMCGLVPVNITATKKDIGKYLVPVADSENLITVKLVAKKDLTFGDYIDACGIIEEIGEDKRPLVSVKIN